MPDRLGQIVEVNVAVESAALSPSSFGKAMILDQHTNFAERFRSYSSLAAMAADGFSTTGQAYLDASALLGQSGESGRRVRDFVVGRRAAPVAQVETITLTFDAAATYTVRVSAAGIAEQVIAVPADTDLDTTVGDIVAALNADAQVAAVATAAAGGAGSGTLTLTADTTGMALVVSVSVAGGAATIATVTTTANVGIAEDLAAIAASAGADFYAILPTSRARHDIIQAAEWVESSTTPFILLAQSSDAAILAAAYDSSDIYTDVASELKGLNYHRTAVFYSASATDSKHAAAAGWVLPFDPGTIDWAKRKLSGVTADTLTDTELQRATGTSLAPTTGKNVNVFIPISSQANVTLRGRMASGRKIEVQRVADWLWSEIRTGIANLLITSNKVPFTDAGIKLVEAKVLGALKVAEVRGVVQPGYSVDVPLASEVSSSDRANGVLPTITANATLTGALDFAQVSLTLSQ